MGESDWTRPPPREPRPLGPRTVLTIFYGYPAELVAHWCGVSVATARLYKRGKRKPSRTVTRLFLLHRERQVLGPEWRGWIVKADGIVDPDGNEIPRNLLHNFFLVMQLARRMAYDREDGYAEEFERLLGT